MGLRKKKQTSAVTWVDVICKMVYCKTEESTGKVGQVNTIMGPLKLCTYEADWSSSPNMSVSHSQASSRPPLPSSLVRPSPPSEFHQRVSTPTSLPQNCATPPPQITSTAHPHLHVVRQPSHFMYIESQYSIYWCCSLQVGHGYHFFACITQLNERQLKQHHPLWWWRYNYFMDLDELLIDTTEAEWREPAQRSSSVACSPRCYRSGSGVSPGVRLPLVWSWQNQTTEPWTKKPPEICTFLHYRQWLTCGWFSINWVVT